MNIEEINHKLIDELPGKWDFPKYIGSLLLSGFILGFLVAALIYS